MTAVRRKSVRRVAALAATSLALGGAALALPTAANAAVDGEWVWEEPGEGRVPFEITYSANLFGTIDIDASDAPHKAIVQVYPADGGYSTAIVDIDQDSHTFYVPEGASVDVRPEAFFYATNFQGLPEVVDPTDATEGEFEGTFLVDADSSPVWDITNQLEGRTVEVTFNLEFDDYDDIIDDYSSHWVDFEVATGAQYDYVSLSEENPSRVNYMESGAWVKVESEKHYDELPAGYEWNPITFEPAAGTFAPNLCWEDVPEGTELPNVKTPGVDTYLPCEGAEVTMVVSYKRVAGATPTPSPTPTTEPTTEPTPDPTTEPTPDPTTEPTPDPTTEPTPDPTTEPTPDPTTEPTDAPTPEPTTEPSPTAEPTVAPTTAPSVEPTQSAAPVVTPSAPAAAVSNSGKGDLAETGSDDTVRGVALTAAAALFAVGSAMIVISRRRKLAE